MKRTLLLCGAWLAATLGLYGALFLLDVYWNLGNWRLRTDLTACGLGLGIIAALAGIWLLARVTRDRMSNSLSLVLCLALLALGLYVLGPEPLTSGLFGRDAPSPLWYRAGRLLVMSLPAVIWAAARYGRPARS